MHNSERMNDFLAFARPFETKPYARYMERVRRWL